MPSLACSMKEFGIYPCHLAFMLETDREALLVNLMILMIQFYKVLIKIMKLAVCSAMTSYILYLIPTRVDFKNMFIQLVLCNV